jgi:hypothetical protein
VDTVAAPSGVDQALGRRLARIAIWICGVRLLMRTKRKQRQASAG